jgi:isopenicillin-N N-acyltransferase-like protein
MNNKLTNQAHLSIETIKGPALEAGRLYGKIFEPMIMGFCSQELKPDETKLNYARECWSHIDKSAPKSAEFMRGMAEGARLSLDHITLLSLHEEIVHQPHCTAFAATGKATEDGSTLVGMNWDWASNLYPWAGLLRLEVTGDPKMLAYHYPGLWASAGINEYGLSLMWTGSGYLPPVRPIVGLPTYVIIAEILRRRNVAEVAEYLQSITHAGCFIFFIGDPSGVVAVIEAAPGKLSIQRSNHVLSRANHYENNQLIECSKQDLNYNKDLTTTCYRAERMTNLLEENHGRLTIETAKNILTDRDGNGPFIHQFPFGQRAHKLEGMTIDSLLADCNNKVLWTCRGGREPGPWQSLTL